ncbi:MAG: serine protease [Ketobacteraceae bacterium]|nr:serine protease [Ketobacteraceae bacterium]
MKYPSTLQSLAFAALAMLSVTSQAQDRVAARIIGGYEVTENYPWIVSIQTRTGSQAFCGGTLIDERWVLTAAHCIEGMSPEFIKAVIGSLDKTSSSAESITIEQIVIHEDYRDGFEVDNDIALLKLSRDSVNTPAELVTSEEMAAITGGTIALVLGWGVQSTGENPPVPDRLYGVELPVRSAAECASRVGSVYDDDLLCAGEDFNGEDSCSGDSGGPLLVDTASGLKHVGIVSFGPAECASAGDYGVYTKTAAYLDWIADNTQGLAVINAPRLVYSIPGMAVTYSLGVANNSEAGALLSDAQLSGTHAADFSIIDDQCQGLLSGGATCGITVSAVSSDEGAVKRADLQVTTDSAVTPLVTTELEVEILTSLDVSNAINNSGLNWYTGGDSPWGISDVAEDGFSLGSGTINANSSSVLAVDVSGQSSLSARVKVSSEADFDGLEIRKDGVLQQFISGNQDWQTINLNTTGVRLVTFVYTKDFSIDIGADRAWIDEVSLGSDSGSDSGSGDSGGPGSGGSVGTALLLGLLLFGRMRARR